MLELARHLDEMARNAVAAVVAREFYDVGGSTLFINVAPPEYAGERRRALRANKMSYVGEPSS